jgi:nucleotide-binding universal stress UspA family protein
MNVIAWIEPGTWPAVVRAAGRRPPDDSITLVAADDAGQSLPTGILEGLMGRGHPQKHPEAATLTADAARGLLVQARESLGRPCQTQVLSGPTERVVTAAAESADWLIIARDGDRNRLGPRSLGRQARFIIDHAPCTVELIWPDGIPGLGTIPPAP